LTLKHQNTTNTTITTTKKSPNVCMCGKEYNDRAGLWRHKKKCNITEDITKKCNNVENISEKELLHKMIESNEIKNEMIINLQQQLIEALNKPTTVNNNNNTQNNQFNLQLYLNWVIIIFIFNIRIWKYRSV